MLLYIKHLFQLIISPGRGWEDIGHADSDPRRLLLNGLLPWLAVVALTSFCRGLYTQTFDYSAINAIIYALVIFVSYFLAYFIAPMAMSFFIDSFLRHRAQTVNRGSILHRAVGHDSSPRELHAFKPYANAFPAHIRCNNNMEGNPLSGDQDGKHRRFHDIGHTFNYRPTLPAQACVRAIGLT